MTINYPNDIWPTYSPIFQYRTKPLDWSSLDKAITKLAEALDEIEGSGRLKKKQLKKLEDALNAIDDAVAGLKVN